MMQSFSVGPLSPMHRDLPEWFRMGGGSPGVSSLSWAFAAAHVLTSNLACVYSQKENPSRNDSKLCN